MEQNKIAVFILLLIVSTGLSADWKLVWSDEFEYSGLPDDTKWGYDIGGGGWGNQELQYYTEKEEKNARVGDGVLTITAIRERIHESDYSSARLVTKNRGDWLYGRVEVAAKLPQGRGVWPAIWMLPTKWEYGGWPASGELDIMENVGFDPYVVHFNIHTESYNHSIGTNKGDKTTLDDPHTTFNIYALEWFEDHVDFFANGDTIFTFKNEGTGYREWPFDKRFHMLINIAVGGTWGGQEGVDDDIFPQEFVIDYVRVYEISETGNITHYVKGKIAAGPMVHVRGNSLCVQTSNLSRISLKVFSVDGSLQEDCSGKIRKGGGRCTVGLKPGAYVAVVNDGNAGRNSSFCLTE